MLLACVFVIPLWISAVHWLLVILGGHYSNLPPLPIFFIFEVSFPLSRGYLFVITHLALYLCLSIVLLTWTKWVGNCNSTLIWIQNRDVCLLKWLSNIDANLRRSSLPIFPVLEMSRIFGSLTVMVVRADIVMPDQSASERFHGDALVHSLEQKIPEHI